eukprot:1956321-Rhodomonas_salina.4
MPGDTGSSSVVYSVLGVCLVRSCQAEARVHVYGVSSSMMLGMPTGCPVLREGGQDMAAGGPTSAMLRGSTMLI